MSLEYDIHSASHVHNESAFLNKITQLLENAGANVTTVETEGRSILTDVGTFFLYTLDPYQEELTKKIYGFRPGYKLGFQCSTRKAEVGHLVLLRLFAALTGQNKDDLVLEFNGESPVIVRLSGHVTVNEKWASAESLFMFADCLKEQYRTTSFPRPGHPVPDWIRH